MRAKLNIATYFLFVFVFAWGRVVVLDAKGIDLGIQRYASAFALDIFFAVFLILITIFLKRVFTFLPYVIIIPIILFHLASMEYIYAMDHVINIKDIFFVTDKQFINGSISHFSFPLYSSFLLIISIFMIVSSANKNISNEQKAYKTKTYMLFCCVLMELFLLIFSTTDWKKNNFINASLNNSLTLLFSKQTTYTEDFPNEIMEKIQINGLVSEGNKLVDLDMHNKKNIIMVVMEGIPGAYLSEVQKYFNVDNNITLTSLDEIKENSIVVPNFLTHNNQTIRGLYSIFSGDYPKLDSSTPKAFEYLQQKNANAHMLPNELKKLGYNTTFIQAAPLEFMSKDRFMSEIGFDNVVGSEGFSYNYIPFGWGVDDKAFFEQSIDYIDEINNQGKPWFVTLLTVGTHHPYAVPDDLEKKHSNRKDAAVEYLDSALKPFIDTIKNSEYAKDTLILFISDESHGVNDQPYGSNWGTCIVYSPDIKQQVINNNIFGLKDIYSSVMDYIDPTSSNYNTGRSIFREYKREDPILFASHLNGDVFYSSEIGKVVLLNNKNELLSIESSNGKMFSDTYNISALNDDFLKKDIILFKDFINQSSIDSNRLSIIDRKNVEIDHGQTEIITDGQFITLQENSYVNISFDYELKNAKEGDNLVFSLEDRENMDLLNIKSVDYRTNKGTMKYSFFNDTEKNGYNFVLRIKASSDKKEKIEIIIKDLNVVFGKDINPADTVSGIWFDSYRSSELYSLNNIIPLLATQGGASVTLENTIDINSSDTNKFLVFGPYIKYPLGKYILEVKFSLEKNYVNTDKLFKIDVVTNSANEVLFEGDFSKEQLEKEENFFVAKIPFELQKDVSDLEIRLKGLRDLNMIIENIYTKKIE